MNMSGKQELRIEVMVMDILRALARAVAQLPEQQLGLREMLDAKVL